MINLSSFSEKFPLPESVVTPENQTNKQFFNQGRDLALLINTPEGVEIVKKATSIIYQIVEKTNESQKPKSNTAPFEGDLLAQKDIRSETQNLLRTWEDRNQSEVQQILTGQKELNNIQQRIFFEIQDPDYKNGLPTTEEQQNNINKFNEFCRSYGFAIDYRSRENSADSLRLPMAEPAGPKLKFANTSIDKVRESFKQGWQSVPIMVEAQVK